MFRSRRRVLALFVPIIVLGAIVWMGSDRQPAEPKEGTELRSAPSESPSASQAMRIASFNIHSGRDAEGEPALEKTSEQIGGLDFIGLQEVRLTPRGDHADLLGTAHALGSAFLPTERRWWHEGFGNGVLSRYATSKWKTVTLVNSTGASYRNYVVCELPWGKRQLTIFTTHLARNADRSPQLQALIKAFKSAPLPAVLLGDLNTPRTDPDLAALLAEPGVVEPFAALSKTDDPERIDWIIARGLKARAAGSLDNGASDHPLVWAEFELAK